jgi:hypothetical protein
LLDFPAGTMGIVDFTNYDDMKYAVSVKSNWYMLLLLSSLPLSLQKNDVSIGFAALFVICANSSCLDPDPKVG